MSASAMLVPVAGVLTQPILARALGTDGRGALAAALAPGAVVVAVATLGLPEAMTYLVARRPGLTRRGLVAALALSMATGIGGLLVALIFVPWLAAGDGDLRLLIVLALILCVPTFALGVLRGTAAGHQAWGKIALERLIVSSARVVVLLVLWQMGLLTVLVALVVSMVLPILASVVYLSLFRSRYSSGSREIDGSVTRQLVTFGGGVWLGTVAEMLISRTGQMLMAPLSNLMELGFFSVAVAVADVPVIAALSIQSALFAVNSKARDVERLSRASRLTIIVASLGCILLGLAVPTCVPWLFGQEFSGAVLPTLLLLVSSVLCVPGLIAGSGLSAWGRPTLRSLMLLLTLTANVLLLVILVPILGALGASTANMASNAAMSIAMVVCASSACGARVSDFLLPRRRDVGFIIEEIVRISRRSKQRPGS